MKIRGIYPLRLDQHRRDLGKSLQGLGLHVALRPEIFDDIAELPVRTLKLHLFSTYYWMRRLSDFIADRDYLPALKHLWLDLWVYEGASTEVQEMFLYFDELQYQCYARRIDFSYSTSYVRDPKW